MPLTLNLLKEFQKFVEAVHGRRCRSQETRSRMISGIRGKNTKPEMVVRRALFSAKLRFRLHQRNLPGVPDIVLPRWRVAVFFHGCFWHRHTGCALSKLPTTNLDFWSNKLDSNVKRDELAIKALRTADWRVLVVWECATRSQRHEDLSLLLSEWIKGPAQLGEIPEADHKWNAGELAIS